VERNDVAAEGKQIRDNNSPLKAPWRGRNPRLFRLPALGVSVEARPRRLVWRRRPRRQFAAASQTGIQNHTTRLAATRCRR